MRLRTALTLFAFVVSGCDCLIDDNNFEQLEDAGFPKSDAGPPPPVFPLKEGDEIEFQLGGRIPDDPVRCPDGATAGDCERDIRVTYTISDTKFDSDDNRWTVESDYVYEGTKDVIPASAIAELILSEAAPFGQVSTAEPLSSTEPGDFTTSVPPTRELNALNFPFFQFESGEAEIFQAAGVEFCDAWTAVDADLECDFSPGDKRMEAYFVDDQAGGKLHQLAVQYHPMGFICDWKEGLADLGADPVRDENSFNGVNPDPVAFFLTPIRLRRDGASYACFCSTGVCRDTMDATKCLDPSDPDEVVTCP